MHAWVGQWVGKWVGPGMTRVPKPCENAVDSKGKLLIEEEHCLVISRLACFAAMQLKANKSK